MSLHHHCDRCGATAPAKRLQPFPQHASIQVLGSPPDGWSTNRLQLSPGPAIVAELCPQCTRDIQETIGVLKDWPTASGGGPVNPVDDLIKSGALRTDEHGVTHLKVDSPVTGRRPETTH